MHTTAKVSLQLKGIVKPIKKPPSILCILCQQKPQLNLRCVSTYSIKTKIYSLDFTKTNLLCVVRVESRFAQKASPAVLKYIHRNTLSRACDRLQRFGRALVNFGLNLSPVFRDKQVPASEELQLVLCSQSALSHWNRRGELNWSLAYSDWNMILGMQITIAPVRNVLAAKCCNYFNLPLSRPME